MMVIMTMMVMMVAMMVDVSDHGDQGGDHGGHHSDYSVTVVITIGLYLIVSSLSLAETKFAYDMNYGNVLWILVIHHARVRRRECGACSASQQTQEYLCRYQL